MSSSRSTPNLDKEAEQTDAMVSRKFRKPSVYEALASKSGLDFAPTIQGRHHWEPKERRNGTTSTVFHQRLSSSTNLQPYHCRQTSSQSTASDCTSSSCNSHAAHSRQLSGHSSYSEDEGGVQSPRSEESLLSSSDVPSYPYGRDSGHTSLPSFPSHHFMTSEESSMTVDEFRGRSHWTSQPDLDCLPSSPGSPPPPAPPVRDSSSLKYAKQGLDHHEKYPSWPVGQQEGTQRSRSWTEIPTSDGLKDKNYPRKKFLQTSYTQQLKTVLEKTEKGVAHDDARFISSLHGQYIGHLNMLQSNHHPMGRSASYEFDTVFEPPERPYAASSYDREFGRRDYNSAHSPPERDLTSEKLQHHKSQQIRQEDAILKDLSQFNNRRQSTTSPNTSSTTVSNTNANHNWWASHQNVGNSYPSETSANQNNASGHNHHHQDTPMLDRLRLESSRWSGDHDKDGRLGNNGGAGGRDSITSTTSSQETLKWHGSSSDLSVKSDKQQPHSVETVVHSARVQPPQRHNSESVLYYGVEEASAIARSVSDVNDCRRDSPSKLKAPAGTPSDNSDIAPPLPRKTRQWADQVQKNNYINRIQMQVRQMGTPRDHGGTESISGPGIRAATLAREEIQPPLSPEFAKPLSVAERIQDLERQARTRSSMNNIQHGGSGHSNRPYVSNTLKASRRPKQVVGNKGQTGNGVGSNSLAWQTNRCEDVSSSSTSLASSTTGGGGSETRMSYLDPEKKHKVSDPELKAIQKQAVWSFFERQTGISAHGRSSISNGNSSKDSAHFLSRRMAQSLPRDYLQEFKRLQQMEERKPSQHHHHASVGPVTTHNAAIANHTITSTAEKNSTRPELNESPERKDINETNAIGPHKHAHSKESGSVSQATIPDKHQRNSKSPKSTVSSRLSSSSSSSSASSISSSSPTSVTTSAYASVLQPHNRTPNVCYNTCTQTDSDIVTITEAVQTSFPEETHHLQNSRSNNYEPPQTSDDDLPEEIIPKSSDANTSGDGSLSKNSMTLVGRDPVSSVSEEVNASTQTASLQELRSTEESSTSPESCNVPCEQTPTKTNVVVVVADESTPKSSFVTCTTIDTDVPFNSSLTSSPSSHLQRESCSYPFSPDVESVEDVELRKIEESAKVLRNLLPCGSSGAYTPKTHRRLFLSSDGTLRNSPSPSLSCQSLSSRCSTPDLPLPPPPKTTDVDLLANDEPLPPPPSISEMTHALAEPQVSNKFSPPATPEDSHISGTHLLYPEEHLLNKSDIVGDYPKNLLVVSKMDHSLSPCTAWEQWHNIRQSSTTLVFNSNEMLNSKKVKTHRVVGSSASFGNSDSKKSSELSNTVTDKTTPISAPSVDEKVSDVSLRHSPVSRLRATNSVESLRSVGSANSTASSTFYWQDNDASRPSSSSSISNGTSSSPSKEADTQPHCPTPLSSERISDTVKSISPELSTDCSPHDSNEVVTQQASSKCTGRKKREEELECERLSRDLFSHLSGQDHVLRKLLGLGPELKTMADYMEGIFEVSIEERPATRRRCSPSSSKSSTSPVPVMEQTKRISGDNVQLPADSAYFTTSESKAKFLNRYSKDMQQQSHGNDLEDMKNGSDLALKKEELVGSITRKLEVLKMEQLAIREEISINEELGASVTGRVEQLAKSNEVDKFKLHVEEVEKITSLLLGLSGRLARAQNALMSMTGNENSEELKSLEAKRNKLSEQHDEAKKLKESIDKRGVQVSKFLHKYLSSEEYADFDHFIKMKAKLLMDAREIDDKIKLGEEQMAALRDNLKT